MGPNLKTEFIEYLINLVHNLWLGDLRVMGEHGLRFKRFSFVGLLALLALGFTAPGAQAAECDVLDLPASHAAYRCVFSSSGCGNTSRVRRDYAAGPWGDPSLNCAAVECTSVRVTRMNRAVHVRITDNACDQRTSAERASDRDRRFSACDIRPTSGSGTYCCESGDSPSRMCVMDVNSDRKPDPGAGEIRYSSVGTRPDSTAARAPAAATGATTTEASSCAAAGGVFHGGCFARKNDGTADLSRPFTATRGEGGRYTYSDPRTRTGTAATPTTTTATRTDASTGTGQASTCPAGQVPKLNGNGCESAADHRIAEASTHAGQTGTALSTARATSAGACSIPEGGIAPADPTACNAARQNELRATEADANAIAAREESSQSRDHIRELESNAQDREVNAVNTCEILGSNNPECKTAREEATAARTAAALTTAPGVAPPPAMEAAAPGAAPRADDTRTPASDTPALTDAESARIASNMAEEDAAGARKAADARRAMHDEDTAQGRRGGGSNSGFDSSGAKNACMEECTTSGSLRNALRYGGTKTRDRCEATGPGALPATEPRETAAQNQATSLATAGGAAHTQALARLEAIKALRACCQQNCGAEIIGRKSNYDSNAHGTYRGDDDGCGQTELLLAADRFAASETGKHYSRLAFFACLRGTTPRAPEKAIPEGECSRIMDSNPVSCNLSKTAATAFQVIDQGMQMVYQYRATTATQDAQHNVELARLQAEHEGKSRNLEKLALTESAKALHSTSDDAIASSATRAIAGAAIIALGVTHDGQGNDVRGVGERNGNSQANVGVDENGVVITGDTASLVGSAARAVSSEEEQKRASDSGASMIDETAKKQEALGVEMYMKGGQLLVQSTQDALRAAEYRSKAAQMKELAGYMDEPSPAATDSGFSGPTDFAGSDGPITAPAPGFIGLGGDGATAGDPIALASPSVDAGPMGSTDPYFNPTGGGPAASGSLADGGGPPGQMVARGDSAGGGGGGGGGAGSGSDGAGGAGGGDAKGETAAKGGPTRMETIGGGGFSTGGGARKNQGTGMDINGLLAQFLPKKGEEKGGAGKSILDFQKGGGRGPAGAGGDDDGSILGPNSNLFLRVSSTTQMYYRRGAIR